MMYYDWDVANYRISWDPAINRTCVTAMTDVTDSRGSGAAPDRVTGTTCHSL